MDKIPEWPNSKILPIKKRVDMRIELLRAYAPPLIKQGYDRHMLADAFGIRYEVLCDYLIMAKVKCPSKKGCTRIETNRPVHNFAGGVQKMKDKIHYLKLAGFHY